MHDLLRIQQDLHESLSLDKHPVALLIGAGCPLSVRVPNSSGSTDPLIPDVVGLTSAVKAALHGDSDFQILLKQFEEDGRTSHTIEDLLSHVRLMRRIVGKGSARGLSAKSLDTLEESLCKHVADAVRRELPKFQTAYHDLADWIGAVPRSKAVQIFTTNYDLLLEQALEARSLPFFDGFVGSQRPFFDLRAIEDENLPPRWTRLWKLHGSISWKLEEDGLVTRVQQPSGTASGLLIHPSELKYDQSRRMPYLAMMDRLRHFLRQPSAFLVTVGYSFADEHLNEALIQGLRSNPLSACFGLLFKDLKDEPKALEVCDRAPPNLTLLSRETGVVRGERGPWLSGSGTPHSSAQCHLGDFAQFSTFLKNLSSRHGIP